MIYQHDAPLNVLEQGDVLKKTKELQSLLTQYHPYYADHKDNKFFAVLTQSCDLAFRSGRSINARYISLAPIRPLKIVLKREFENKLENVGSGRQPFATHRVRSSLEQFLQRLFNNNEPPFFYYETAHEKGIYEEMCAMLALPISLKPEHYETLISAKLAGITDVFQAKLGWLVGQMYSRVGTPDFPPNDLSKKVKDYTEGVAIWLDDSDAKKLRDSVQQFESGSGKITDQMELRTLISKLPKRKNIVIDAVLDVVSSQGFITTPSPERRNLRLALEQDPTFSSLFT